MNRKWVQKGVQNVTKNHEKSTPAPECDFGAIWGRFLTDFRQIWGRFLTDFRLIWDRFLIDFDLIFCTHFSASKTTENEKLAKAHEPVAAKKHPAFDKNALSVPLALLTRLHTPSAANQHRFFNDFSDVFLERFLVDLGVPFGAVLLKTHPK